MLYDWHVSCTPFDQIEYTIFAALWLFSVILPLGAKLNQIVQRSDNELSPF